MYRVAQEAAEVREQFSRHATGAATTSQLAGMMNQKGSPMSKHPTSRSLKPMTIKDRISDSPTPEQPPRSPQAEREVRRNTALRTARTCYDHLAGVAGVHRLAPGRDYLWRPVLLGRSQGRSAPTVPTGAPRRDVPRSSRSSGGKRTIFTSRHRRRHH